MPDAELLLTDFAARGIRLFPAGDNIIAEPASRLTDADRQAIRANKNDLIAYLADRDALLDGEIDRLGMADGWLPDDVTRAIEADEVQRARDRADRRGFDFDTTAPSHADFCESSIFAHPRCPCPEARS